MVPRIDMICIPSDLSLDELLSFTVKSSHTRFHVYEGNIDTIIGILHIKDLFSHSYQKEREEFDLKKIIRPVPIVPETTPIATLLSTFKQQKTQMAIVVDEFGGTAGLITLEDIIEEIVGEMHDEFDTEEMDIVTLPEGDILLHPRVRIDELNERFNLHISDEDFDTLGGYMLAQLGRIAHAGDAIEMDGCKIIVQEVDGIRITRIKLTFDQKEV
ncbi:MAG: HlyC/CorC family transporter [Candidatus Tectomicrobia bacterium]|nr:HlyC/CorC family transporter [Candidatus Tectomicrobia bacterium]